MGGLSLSRVVWTFLGKLWGLVGAVATLLVLLDAITNPPRYLTVLLMLAGQNASIIYDFLVLGLLIVFGILSVRVGVQFASPISKWLKVKSTDQNQSLELQGQIMPRTEALGIGVQVVPFLPALEVRSKSLEQLKKHHRPQARASEFIVIQTQNSIRLIGLMKGLEPSKQHHAYLMKPYKAFDETSFGHFFSEPKTVGYWSDEKGKHNWQMDLEKNQFPRGRVSASVAVNIEPDTNVVWTDNFELYVEPRQDVKSNLLSNGIKFYPSRKDLPGLQDDLESAKHRVDLLGWTLENVTVQNRHTIARLLKNGIHVRFILLSPDSKLIETAERSMTSLTLKKSIERSLEELKELKDSLSNIERGRLDIRTHDLLPWHTLVLVDAESDNAMVNVEYYVYGTDSSSCPSFRFFKKEQPAWFSKYWESYQYVWERSKEYAQ